MRRSAHLALVPPAPPAPTRPPLISSEAQRNEAKGVRPYTRVHLKPKELPSTYMTLTAFPRRVERRTWRTPVSVAIGVFVGLAALGIGAGGWSLLFGGAATLAALCSDGWLQ